MRPNFKDIQYTKETWKTPEQIEVKSIYTEADLE